MNEKQLPNAGMAYIPLQVIHKIRKESKAGFWLLLLLFLGMSSGTLYSQTSLSVGSNPAVVVKMGDPISFSVNATSTTAMSNAEIEIKAPVGFEILSASPALKPGSLSGDKLTARVVINLVANTQQTITFSVKPLCDADAVASASRIMTYKLYASGSSTALATRSSQSIGNFYTPILSVTYPPSVPTNLNVVSTRTMIIEQTANNSYVNNIKIDAACDTSGLKVTKLEVSKDQVTWVDATPTALNITANNKYQYFLTKANTFTPLGYINNSLGLGTKLYIRETILLKKCTAGNTNYSVSYGDGNTFCGVIASGATTLSVAAPGYVPDIRYTAGANPTSPSTNGRFTYQMMNSSTDPEAKFYDVLMRVANTDNSTYEYKRAYFTTTAGAPVLNNGTDTVFIPVENKLNIANNVRMYFVAFDKLNNSSLAAFYQTQGLSDLDGDGVYNDMVMGANVTVTVEFNINFNFLDNAADPCKVTYIQPRSNSQAYIYYNDLCRTLRTYMRPYGSSQTSDNFRSSFGTLKPRIYVSQPNVSSGNALRLSYNDPALDPDGTGAFLVGLINSTSSYYTTIGLPLGMDFDSANPTAITVAGNPVAASDITIIDSRNIRFRNRISASGSTITIAVIGNSTLDTDKQFTIKHHYDYGNLGSTNERTWGCYSCPVPYIQVLPCTDLSLVGFGAERTTFGWTNISKATKITKVDGANVKLAAPYDNISLVGKANVGSNSSITATDSIMVAIQYNGVAGTVANAYLVSEPGNANTVKVRYVKISNPSTSIYIDIPATELKASYLLDNGTAIHGLAVNIAPAMRSNGITAMALGDTCEVTLYTQTRGNLPVKLTSLEGLQMEVYRTNAGVKTSCNPLIDDKFYLIDPAYYTLGSTTGANNGPWNENAANGSSTFANIIAYTQGAGSNYYTAGEYRPNSDPWSNIVLRVNSLIKVNGINVNPSGKQLGNEVAGALASGTDYDVTYNNGETTITIKNTEDFMTVSSLSGLVFSLNWEMINRNGMSKYVTFTRMDYPTSENPVQRGATNSDIGFNYSVTNPYRYSISSSAPIQSPLGRIAEWPVQIVNQSVWVATDGNLPNSWIAVECPAGVVPYRLLDADNGNSIVANDVDFISYGTDKYWVKLNTLVCPTNRNFKLQCTYSVCTGTPGITFKYGMSKVDYPTDPAQGYANYNSPGFLKGVVTTSLQFTPPVANFTGALAHTPTNGDGTNNFCSDIDFAATFTNGLQTKVSNMVLHLNLPVGMDYNGVLPTVQLGSGAAVAVTSAVQTGRLLEIEVSPTLELDAFGTPDQSAVVHFALTTGCGFINGLQIYADFIGESGCGAKTTKTYNSAQVKIAGLSVIADYLVGGKNIDSQMPYQNATTNNGRIVFTGKYVLSGAATPDDAAFIDLPGNMILTAQNGDLNFTQTGTRLSAFFDHTGTAPSGKNYDFTITLDPVNPAAWDCDSTHFIKVKSGIIKTMTCGMTTCDLTAESALKDSVSFSMTKLNVALSPVIKLTSVYENATTERVKIEGKLKNLSSVATNQFIFDLYTHNGTSYVPVSAPGNMVVNAIPANDSTAFTLLADISTAEDVCKLKLVLRKDNMTGGMSNNYLCDSIVYNLTSIPVYDLQPITAVCPMAVNTPVGDNAITGYSYNWSPATYLGSTNVSKPNFTYNYLAAPAYNDTVIGYAVTVTRPGGCSSVDSVYVPVKALAYVDFVADTTICYATPLSIIFADSKNTSANPTTYTWTNSNTTIGLAASGSGNINVASLTNSTSSPIMATITVTPTRNGCTGVSRTFVVTVYPNTTITTQPSIDPAIVLPNGYIRPGSNVDLSVVATGLNITYQWYWKKASDGTVVTLTNGSKYSGTTSSTLQIANAYEEENGDYYVTATGCGSATSNPVTIIAVANQDASLKDLKIDGTTLWDFNPATINYMTTVLCAQEQVTILGIPNNPNYTSITGNGTFQLAPGDNLFTITVVAQDMVTTMTYTVNVIRDCYIPKILKDLEDAVICVGDTHTFEIDVKGENLTYEWYYGLNRIMGANTNSLTISDAVLGDYERYYVVIRSHYNDFKSSVFSKKVRLWVADQLPTHLKFSDYPNPAITGNTYHIKVDGYTDVTKYTWSYDKEGVSFSPGADLKWGNEVWGTFGTLSAGNGILKVTMEHPCGTRELLQPLSVKYSTGIEDVTATTVQVYPNPTSGILKVSGTEMNQQIRILDVTGSLKGTYKTMEGTTTIDLTGYAKGTYIVQYNGKTYKVIKK